MGLENRVKSAKIEFPENPAGFLNGIRYSFRGKKFIITCTGQGKNAKYYAGNTKLNYIERFYVEEKIEELKTSNHSGGH